MNGQYKKIFTLYVNTLITTYKCDMKPCLIDAHYYARHTYIKDSCIYINAHSAAVFDARNYFIFIYIYVFIYVFLSLPCTDSLAIKSRTYSAARRRTFIYSFPRYGNNEVA